MFMMFLAHNTFQVFYGIWTFSHPSLPIWATTSSRKTPLTTPVRGDLSQWWIDFVLKDNTLKHVLHYLLIILNVQFAFPAHL